MDAKDPPWQTGLAGQRKKLACDVEDIRKLALPLGAEVIAADGALRETVHWAYRLGPDDDLMARVPQPGELLLIDESATRPSVDDTFIRWASEQGVRAIVTTATPAPLAIAAANRALLPLITLPEGSDLGEIQREILALLVDRRGQLVRRSTQVFRQLTQLSSHNAGPAPLLEALARLTGKSAILQDKRLEITHSSLQPALISQWEDIERSLREPATLPSAYQDRLRIPPEALPTQQQTLANSGFARIVAPILTHGVGRGFLSLIGPAKDLDALDMSVAEQGAVACALEMAKAKAISNTEKRLLGTFLDRILSNEIVPQEALLQGERFGHNLRQAHVALAAAWYGPSQPSLRRLETIFNFTLAEAELAGGGKPLVGLRDPYLLAFLPVAAANNGTDTVTPLAARIQSVARRERARAALAIGISTVATDLSEWQNIYNEALQAMDLAARLHSSKPLSIGTLGIYRLIIQLEERDTLQSFARQTLGNLLDYDIQQNTDLLQTLEAYFSADGNLSATATELNVHRNTLLYRLRRISEIGEIDLKQPETRLALQLALAILRLLPEN